MRTPNRHQAKSGVSKNAGLNSISADRLAIAEADTRQRIARRIVRAVAAASLVGLVRRPDAVKALSILQIGGDK